MGMMWCTACVGSFDAYEGCMMRYIFVLYGKCMVLRLKLERRRSS